MFFRLVLEEEEVEILQTLLPLIVAASSKHEREQAMYALGFNDIRKFVVTMRHNPQLLESFQILLFLLLSKEEHEPQFEKMRDKIIFTNDEFERRFRRIMGWRKKTKEDVSLSGLEEMWEMDCDVDEWDGHKEE